MEGTPWRDEIERALRRHADLMQARYVQLATIRPDGSPANRTVVFRGFAAGSDRLIFTTDGRSTKAEQIQRDARVEACWYFADTREQFRVGGMASMPGVSDADWAPTRLRIWAGLSEPSRTSFGWPAPGQPFLEILSTHRVATNPDQPLESFRLLILEPSRVEHLILTTDPHTRWVYDRGDGRAWGRSRINP